MHNEHFLNLAGRTDGRQQQGGHVAGLFGIAALSALAMMAMPHMPAAEAKEAGVWSYHGETGPDKWGDLKPEYALCKTGRNQSPVDISGAVGAELPALGFKSAATAAKVLNNGHTIKVSVEPGNVLEVDGKQFKLLQFHFHSPSENKVNGKHFPMEVHMVHMDDAGNLAVVGVMFKEGKENANLQKSFAHMPMTAGETKSLPEKLEPYALLPENKGYFRFSGSLTTPPCTEGVRWFVMSEPVEASAAQIAAFRKAMGDKDTNRPVQPLNARIIMQQK